MIQIYVYGDRLLSGSNRGYQFPVFNWIKVLSYASPCRAVDKAAFVPRRKPEAVARVGIGPAVRKTGSQRTETQWRRASLLTIRLTNGQTVALATKAAPAPIKTCMLLSVGRLDERRLRPLDPQ